MLHIAVTALLLASIPSQDVSRDTFLLSGEVRYQRKDKFAEFDLATGAGPVAKVRLAMELAFPTSSSRTISALWASVLLNEPFVSIRVGKRLDAGLLRPIRAKTSAMCSVQPAHRESDIASYALKCVALDSDLQAKKDGELVTEIVLAVMLRTGSPGDTLLKEVVTSAPIVTVWID